MENLRNSAVLYFTYIFNNLNKEYNYIYNFKASAIKLENEIYELLDTNIYIKKIDNIKHLLMINNGYFPDDIIGVQFMQKKITTKDILYFDVKTIDTNTRIQIIKMFIFLLYKYEKNKDTVLDIAKTIEKSCYNAIIKNSKQSEDPPCRQWDSPIFVDIYSNRCGIIYNLLDPNSLTNKLYDSNLLKNILDKTIDIKEIGFKSEKELCPKATQKERNEISIRSEQYVIEKESNLFRCPNCKERRVTYREVQLRALDEAPDYLCKCLNCKHRFKGK